MLFGIPIIFFAAGLLCETLTEVEGFGPDGPVSENEDGIIPVEIHVSFERKAFPGSFQGLYPFGSYGLGYQYPSVYPGLLAKYQR